MALYQSDNRVKCECGCEQFVDVDIFIIEKVFTSNKLTNNIVHSKVPVSKGIKCVGCGKVRKDPTE